MLKGNCRQTVFKVGRRLLMWHKEKHRSCLTALTKTTMSSSRDWVQSPSCLFHHLPHFLLKLLFGTSPEHLHRWGSPADGEAHPSPMLDAWKQHRQLVWHDAVLFLLITRSFKIRHFCLLILYSCPACLSLLVSLIFQTVPGSNWNSILLNLVKVLDRLSSCLFLVHCPLLQSFSH